MAACSHPYCILKATKNGFCDICIRYEPGGDLEDYRHRPGGCACTAASYGMPPEVLAKQAAERQAIRSSHNAG